MSPEDQQRIKSLIEFWREHHLGPEDVAALERLLTDGTQAELRTLRACRAQVHARESQHVYRHGPTWAELHAIVTALDAEITARETP